MGMPVKLQAGHCKGSVPQLASGCSSERHVRPDRRDNASAVAALIEFALDRDQIAAIAVHHGLTLVTHNTGEFSRISGLNLQDWQS
jgi:predicted nucleic acid-binding protein